MNKDKIRTINYILLSILIAEITICTGIIIGALLILK